MIAIYGMAVCGIGFVGFAAAYTWPTPDNKRSVSVSETTSTNQVLREKTANFSASLRRYNENFKTEKDAQLRNEFFTRRNAAIKNERPETPDEISRRFQNDTNTSLAKTAEFYFVFNKTYRPAAIALREELISRLSSLGIISPYAEQSHQFDMIEAMLYAESFAGSNPIGILADYFDFLARKFPD